MGDMAEYYAFSQDFGMFDDGEEPYIPTPKRCRYCGQGNLEWAIHQGQWRLRHSDTGKIHTCKAFYDHKAKEARNGTQEAN